MLGRLSDIARTTKQGQLKGQIIKPTTRCQFTKFQLQRQECSIRLPKKKLGEELNKG